MLEKPDAIPHRAFFDAFDEVSKSLEAGATSKPKKDCELSRYACYLNVQNGDPRKKVLTMGLILGRFPLWFNRTLSQMSYKSFYIF